MQLLLPTCLGQSCGTAHQTPAGPAGSRRAPLLCPPQPCLACLHLGAGGAAGWGLGQASGGSSSGGSWNTRRGQRGGSMPSATSPAAAGDRHKALLSTANNRAAAAAKQGGRAEWQSAAGKRAARETRRPRTAAVCVKVPERLADVGQPHVQLLKLLKRDVPAGQGAEGRRPLCSQQLSSRADSGTSCRRPRGSRMLASRSSTWSQLEQQPGLQQAAHPEPSRSCSRIIACAARTHEPLGRIRHCSAGGKLARTAACALHLGSSCWVAYGTAGRPAAGRSHEAKIGQVQLPPLSPALSSG